MRHRLAFAVASLLAVSLLPGCSGQRLLHVEIERNGVRPLRPSTVFPIASILQPCGRACKVKRLQRSPRYRPSPQTRKRPH